MGGGTSSYQEIEETDCILLWGSNARETHPIFFHHLLKGLKHGARLFTIDPRRTTSAEWADVWVGLDVGTDIALANAVGREIIAAGLANEAFINHATDGFEAYRDSVERLDARSRRAGHRRAGAGDPRDGPRLRHGAARDAVLDARHHRASLRRGQRPGAHQPRAPHRARRPVGQRHQPAARAEQRAGRRRHGRAARSPAGLPARRGRAGAAEVRARLGRGGAAEARLAPVGDVRRDGARRPEGGLRHRREPDPVRSRPASRHAGCSACSTR